MGEKFIFLSEELTHMLILALTMFKGTLQKISRPLVGHQAVKHIDLISCICIHVSHASWILTALYPCSSCIIVTNMLYDASCYPRGSALDPNPGIFSQPGPCQPGSSANQPAAIYSIHCYILHMQPLCSQIQPLFNQIDPLCTQVQSLNS